mmetsp:Transcript_61042/g.175862  ORF Transcript_61042/g.175862 Transcript_61042/m.175862 type:complete len:179 (-) Transcript_61042:217-753(-)
MALSRKAQRPQWRQDEATGFWWAGDDGPYDHQRRKIASTPEELIHAARGIAVRAVTAGFITVTPEGFPRCRTIRIRGVAEDFSEVLVGTRTCTRKFQEASANEKVMVYWQERGGQERWVTASGTAVVEEGQGDEARIRVQVRTVELQDYDANITGDGTDRWKPVIIERGDGSKWQRLQ